MSFDVVDPGHRDKCVREWCCSDRAVNKTLRNFTLPREGSFKAWCLHKESMKTLCKMDVKMGSVKLRKCPLTARAVPLQ